MIEPKSSAIAGRVTDVCFLVSVGPVLLSSLRETNAENPGASKPTFMCPICGLTSSFKSSMKRHMANHSKARPFRCEVCFKAFKRKDYLKQHALCHTVKDVESRKKEDKGANDN